MSQKLLHFLISITCILVTVIHGATFRIAHARLKAAVERKSIMAERPRENTIHLVFLERLKGIGIQCVHAGFL